MRRFLCVMMVMCLLPVFALAEMVWVDVIPTPSGAVQEMTAVELLQQLNATPTPQPTPQAQVDTTFDLLIIGSDNYASADAGRSDAMVLARLDADRGTVKMISFMRDLYVKIPGKGYNRLNAAYVFGGAELLKDTLYANFGVTCDAYVAVNFSLMADLIDQIGGVTVHVTKQEMKQVNSILKFYNRKMGVPASDQLLDQYGHVPLTGKQAMCFSRIRKIDSDHQRVGRQQAVLEAIFHKVTQLDILTLGRLVLNNIERVNTDLQPEQIGEVAALALNARSARFESLKIPQNNAFSSETRSGMAVLVPNLKKNNAAIQAFWQEEP